MEKYTKEYYDEIFNDDRTWDYIMQNIEVYRAADLKKKYGYTGELWRQRMDNGKIKTLKGSALLTCDYFLNIYFKSK